MRAGFTDLPPQHRDLHQHVLPTRLRALSAVRPAPPTRTLLVLTALPPRACTARWFTRAFMHTGTCA